MANSEISNPKARTPRWCNASTKRPMAHPTSSAVSGLSVRMISSAIDEKNWIHTGSVRPYGTGPRADPYLAKYWEPYASESPGSELFGDSIEVLLDHDRRIADRADPSLVEPGRTRTDCEHLRQLMRHEQDGREVSPEIL